jgi:hypothetical protein
MISMTGRSFERREAAELVRVVAAFRTGITKDASTVAEMLIFSGLSGWVNVGSDREHFQCDVSDLTRRG